MLNLKTLLLTLLTLLTLHLPLTLQAHPHHPTRAIAGVPVIDTPLVRAAQAFARAHASDWVYGHIMRSWLFGALLISSNLTTSAAIDLEVHAIAALLHDLGWERTPDSQIVTPDRRFEVDGAIAARGFLRSHEEGRGWGERRVQLVWDAIALHTERSIAYYKEVEVEVVSRGISLDFTGPAGGVRREDYERVEREFPRVGLRNDFNETIVWLCQTKSGTTYDTWMQPWGDSYVPGYSAVGSRRIDTVFANLPN